MWSQEHVILLRGLVVAFPGQYADLGLLLDKDSELDFFNNVAHLQLHRRQRALQRLTKVSLPSALCPLCIQLNIPGSLRECSWLMPNVASQIMCSFLYPIL